MTSPHTTPDEKQKTERAMAALDTMATIWAMSFNLREGVKAMMALPDGEDRLIAFIKHCYVEGLYEGRISHKKPEVAQERAAPLEVVSGMTEPEAWRTRYRSEPGMLGHYPWTYSGRKPKLYGADNHEVERLYTEAQVRAMLAASPPPPGRMVPLTEERIKDICSLIYASDYPGGVKDLVLGCAAYDIAIVRVAERAHGIKEGS